MTEFFDQFFCEANNDYSVVVEDDGRVAYAYLLYLDNIIGEVWLYNQASTPKEPEWHSKEKMPFLNSDEFIKENISPILGSEELKVDWKLSKGIYIDEVLISIRDKLVAMLAQNSTPGWSLMVSKDGPLAKRMENDNLYNPILS